MPRELKREKERDFPRETERNHLACTLFLSNQTKNDDDVSVSVVPSRNKNAKRIIIKRTTKVAALLEEVVFVVALSATMDVVNVVLAVVAENIIIFVLKV